MSEKNQFVIVPNSAVECDDISPKSLVIYCAIRRHMNNKTLEAYPSVSTIAKEAGCGEDLVRKAIKELEDNGFIKSTKRNGQSTLYKFSETKKFEPFSYDFLDDTKLKIREKAYLIMNQKNMFKKDGIGVSSYSTKEIAEKVRMSIPTVLSCENKLIKAGYLQKIDSKNIDKETGLNEKLRYYLLEMYNAISVTYHQVEKNTEDIENLKKENAEMKKTIEILKRKVFQEEIPEAIIL